MLHVLHSSLSLSPFISVSARHRRHKRRSSLRTHSGNHVERVSSRFLGMLHRIFSLSLSLRQMRSGWRKTTFSSTFQCAAEDLQSQLHPTGGLLWFRIRKKEQKKVPNPADTRKLKVAASVRRPMAQFLTSSRKRVSQFWKLGLKNERAYEVNTRLNSATKSDSFSDAKSFHY